MRELSPPRVTKREVGQIDRTEHLLLCTRRFEREAAAEHHVETHAERPEIGHDAIGGRRLSELRRHALVPVPYDDLGR